MNIIGTKYQIIINDNKINCYEYLLIVIKDKKKVCVTPSNKKISYDLKCCYFDIKKTHYQFFCLFSPCIWFALCNHFKTIVHLQKTCKSIFSNPCLWWPAAQINLPRIYFIRFSLLFISQIIFCYCDNQIMRKGLWKINIVE